jgi:hypothetical protein
MKIIMKPLFTLRAYLITALIEGVLNLIFLLLIPSDPKNVWVMGLSRTRILMLLADIICVAVVGYLVGRILKEKSRLMNIESRVETIVNWDANITTGIVLSLAGLVGGIIFLNSTFTTTDLFLEGYYLRLAPWMLWFTLFCGQTLLFLIFRDPGAFQKYLQKHGVALFILLVVLISGLSMHMHLWELLPEEWDTNKLFTYDNKFDIYQQDIRAVFSEGTNLMLGKNPYERVHALGKNLTWNYEIPTYFPVFYYLSWFTQAIGFEDYIYWLDLWRIFFLLANLGIAYLLFTIPYHRYNSLWFAILAAAFWLFNRWTLNITMIYHIDFLAILFFLLSLGLWPKHKVAALLSFGLSLGIKQIAIFMLPFYILWIWQSVGKDSPKKFFILVCVLGIIPLLVSSPFLLLDAGGFIKSVLLSATRNPESHFGIPSLDALLVWSGIPAKIPMLGLMLITLMVAWKRKIDHFGAALLVMAIFTDFNSVLFRQYMAWVVPLIPLAIAPMLARLPGDGGSETETIFREKTKDTENSGKVSDWSKTNE